ncbi:MAG: hypothetical protein IKU28_06640 [Erysipelotrichaceae bacterium]|nr:hypothetical protein [Erysipelotrichaceae bacterium]
MRKLIVLSLVLILTGCSCSTTTATPTPTPSPTPSATPSASPESMTGNTKGYLDYLSKNYTLNNPAQIQDLDGNAMEGYTFGMDSADFYLLRFDRSNSNASQWLNEADKNGYIEVKINGTLEKYYAIVNQDYMLLYSTDNLDSKFVEYFQNYPYQTPSQNQSY